jgi:hypothetical protein
MIRATRRSHGGMKMKFALYMAYDVGQELPGNVWV